MTTSPTHRRGTEDNPPNRFEKLHLSPDPEGESAEGPAPGTQFFKDTSRTAIAHNNSSDVGFETSLNPYRGCEHGCIYCYARPFHEYLGFSAGLDFETKIMVKTDAPELLRRELSTPRWKPQVIVMSGVTDGYQPVERRLKLTRRCLEVLAEFRNPVAIITKNHLVTRDRDLLGELAQFHAASVTLSITTLDAKLTRIMEPRTSVPSRRLDAIETLARAGVPAGVNVAPVIPGLTDHELPSILSAAARAGAQFAGYTPVRLPYGVKDLFQQWLERTMPARKNKVLNRIRSIHGGPLNDARFGHRMEGEGIFAEQIDAMFTLACRRAGIHPRSPELSTSAFRPSQPAQLLLFS